MDFSLFDKIVHEFSEHGAKLTYNNFSDIFADKSGLEYVKRAVGIETYLVTNALGLGAKTQRALRDMGFSGRVFVACHGLTPETYRFTTGVDAFHVAHRNIVSLLEWNSDVVIQCCVDWMMIDELERAQAYWEALRVGFNPYMSHTFCGLASHKPTHTKKVIRGCRGWLTRAEGQPMAQAIVQVNGDVTLCCHDLKGSIVIGNVQESSLAEVWNSDRYKEVIEMIYTNTAPSDFICRKCLLAS